MGPVIYPGQAALDALGLLVTSSQSWEILTVLAKALPEPKDARDSNGAKAPGLPCEDDGYVPGKDGPKWVQSPNGRGYGWEDAVEDVWIPSGWGGGAHGGPHWDVQKKKGGYINVYPGGRRR